MLAWPIAMATSAAIDSIKNIPTDEKCNSSSNYNQDFSIDEIIPLSRLTDKEYEYIKQNYLKMLEQPREMGEMTLKDFVPMSLRCQMRSNRKSGKCKEKQNIAGERFANHYPRRCKI